MVDLENAAKINWSTLSFLRIEFTIYKNVLRLSLHLLEIKIQCQIWDKGGKIIPTVLFLSNFWKETCTLLAIQIKF